MTHDTPFLRAVRVIWILCAVTVAAGCGSRSALPEPGTAAYQEAVISFYTSLAALQAGEDLGAEDNLLRVTNLAPGEPAAWANLGLLALRRNELGRARERLNRAVELAPENSAVRLLLAALYSQEGNFDAEVAALREAVRLAPDDPRALYALAQAVERQSDTGSAAEVAGLLDRLRVALPGNTVVLLDRLRVAAAVGDTAAFETQLDALAAKVEAWPDDVQVQFALLREAAQAGTLAEAGRQVVFLRNVLLSLPEYRRDLEAVRTTEAQAGDLIDHFLELQPPRSEPAAADTALAFEPVPLEAPADPAAWYGVVWTGQGAQPVPAAYRSGRLSIEAQAQALGGPGEALGGVAQGDLDYDFYTDVALAGPGGLRLYRSDSTGAFTEVTDRLPDHVAATAFTGVWMADVDLEGDLDLVLGTSSGAPVVLRNNGDSTFVPQQPLDWQGGVRAFAWADLDADGDPDPAVLGMDGVPGLWRNEREGLFLLQEVPALPAPGRALHASDIDGDGVVELVLLLEDGGVVVVDFTGAGWTVRSLGSLSLPADASTGLDDAPARIAAADLDNNGMLDVVASASGRAAAWLATGGEVFLSVPVPGAADLAGIADLDGDGRLDLVGRDTAGVPVRWRNRGAAPYHWQTLRLRAARATGDQRINTFAYGGRAEVRTGLLYQQQPIAAPVLHFGLGRHPRTALARIVWPNGDVQAEFDLDADQTLLTPQRLKGSCPWVFAYDGEGMRFVTDFIWRSPLGLRINAQQTAGVMMTGDWIVIRNDQLKPRDGYYDVRITAELWETHFFDQVGLMVVDHPAETDVFVDERFVVPPAALAWHALTPPHPVARALDGAGRDVSDLLRARDDRYVATFPMGAYQGVAREHVLDLELDVEEAAGPVAAEAASTGGGLVLVASGWVRPTDSSINVALSQGNHAPPQGIRLEVPDGRGGWRVVHENLGFPAGKDKTVLLPLDDAFAHAGTHSDAGVGTEPEPRRVRIRTNLEIYWDRIAWAERRPEAEARVQTLRPEAAELRYRGFSELVQPNRRTPERPVYDRLAGTAPRWMDLEGYYTRFGDVVPLLDAVDDRYVIMNAGDELRFRFAVPGPPPPGWTRTFILTGDGWVKDGDFNTGFSETVLPLPAHDTPAYATPPGRLEDDPVYRRHRGDWIDYHTRYVGPERFQEALRAPRLP